MAGPFSTAAGVRLPRYAGVEHPSRVAARLIASKSVLNLIGSTRPKAELKGRQKWPSPAALAAGEQAGTLVGTKVRLGRV